MKNAKFQSKAIEVPIKVSITSNLNPAVSFDASKSINYNNKFQKKSMITTHSFNGVRSEFKQKSDNKIKLLPLWPKSIDFNKIATSVIPFSKKARNYDYELAPSFDKEINKSSDKTHISNTIDFKHNLNKTYLQSLCENSRRDNKMKTFMANFQRSQNSGAKTSEHTKKHTRVCSRSYAIDDLIELSRYHFYNA